MLALSIVGLAIGAGLLSLVALRWIGFLGLPPVFFLTVLFLGMPVGGLLLLRIHRLRKLRLSLVVLWSTGLSVVAAILFLVAIHWTNTKIDLHGAEFDSLVWSHFSRFLAAAIMFLPLFVGYGMIEFAAFRAGLAGLENNSALVYALNLAGLMLAFLGYRLLLAPLGTSGLFAIGIALFLLTSFFLQHGRYYLAIGALVVAFLPAIPGIENLTISALEVKTGEDTLTHWDKPPNQLILDEWTPFCRLSLVDNGHGILGFYEGIYYWYYPRDMPSPRESPGSYRRPDLSFSILVHPGDKVAVLGAGGGVQVAAALRAGAGRVYAVEVVPAVLEVLSGSLSKNIENTYSDPRVVLVPKNARRFLEECPEQLDVIVLASVESHLGGLRELFEPSQVLFTDEAFTQMKSHLVPGGILAISKYTSVDRRGIIITQCFAQLEKLGMSVRGYIKLPSLKKPKTAGYHDMLARGTHYLVVAQNGTGRLDALATLDNFFRGSRVKPLSDPPPVESLPRITDDRAFATGMLIANLGLMTMAEGIAGLAAVLAAFGLALAWAMRRTLKGMESDMHGYRLSAASLLVGFNFMVIEYLMVYRLMRHLDIPMDATFLGMVAFAGLAAAGGVLLARRSSGQILAFSAIIAAFLATAAFLLPSSSLIFVAAAAFITGSLFPKLLRGPDDRLVRVYVFDAYGTLWGGLAALLVPLFLGFSGHQAVAALGLVMAAWSVHSVAAARTNKGGT